MALVVLVVITVSAVSTTTQNACHAIAQPPVAHKSFAISQENVHACKTSLENVAISAWRVFTSSQNAWLVIATCTVRTESRVTTKVIATVSAASMEKRAVRARKITTIIRSASRAIVIQLESLQSLLVADLYQLENCVSARSEYKEEFAISVDHCTGILTHPTQTVVKSAIASPTELSEP